MERHVIWRENSEGSPAAANLGSRVSRNADTGNKRSMLRLCSSLFVGLWQFLCPCEYASKLTRNGPKPVLFRPVKLQEAFIGRFNYELCFLCLANSWFWTIMRFCWSIKERSELYIIVWYYLYKECLLVGH